MIIYMNLILNKLLNCRKVAPFCMRLLKGISSQREHLERFQCRDQVKLRWARQCLTFPSMKLLGALCCQVILGARLASLLPVVLLLQLLHLHCFLDGNLHRCIYFYFYDDYMVPNLYGFSVQSSAFFR
jgi:hypothetical protein